MASQVIRGRIALGALFIAIAFVIIGFLQADREMTRAEHDRATVTVSETATLVEVFLLRELVQLRSLERLVAGHMLDGSKFDDSLLTATSESSSQAVPFDGVWIVDAGGQLRTIPFRNHEIASLDTNDLAELTRRRSRPTPFVRVRGGNRHRTLMFVEPMETPIRQTLVAVVAADSLAVMLERQQRRKPVRVVVTASTDTVTQLGVLSPNDKSRMLRQSVGTPLANDWAVAIAYIPSGRGARIALWVVGLGAIVGLGIGLLLERHEMSRIADRSSELEHLSAELLRANRAKSEFLANVSHELRTPLNAIVGFVDLLRDGVYGPLNSRQAGPVERIEASANHLRHLVDQVLDLAKMAAGRLEVHAEPIELRPFVFDVASEVEPLMTEKGLSLSLAVGASLPRVRTDPTHLRQILINLLGNAVKFTLNGGISVRGKLVRRAEPTTSGGSERAASLDRLVPAPKDEASWIALQVADSGIGIPERDRDRIFDEFEQVNAGPRGDSMRRGTGLGLSISRRLARLLGGDITVESELGRGSVFTVWLPVDPIDLRGDGTA
jgi:signal transduction histidine kinase